MSTESVSICPSQATRQHLTRNHVGTTTYLSFYATVLFSPIWKAYKMSSELPSLRCRQYIVYFTRLTVSFSNYYTISIKGSNNRHRSVLFPVVGRSVSLTMRVFTRTYILKLEFILTQEYLLTNCVNFSFTPWPHRSRWWSTTPTS